MGWNPPAVILDEFHKLMATPADKPAPPENAAELAALLDRFLEWTKSTAHLTPFSGMPSKVSSRTAAGSFVH